MKKSNINKNNIYSISFPKKYNNNDITKTNYFPQNKSLFQTPHFRNWGHLQGSFHRSCSERPSKLENVQIFSESPIIDKDFDLIYSSENGERFRKVALAVASSRGPTCEDRKIMRKNRGDIGGVVDFWTEKNLKKSMYKIVKMKRQYINYDIEPQKKIKASKTIQKWWIKVNKKKKCENN